MDDITKRMNYFDRQFLRAEDFRVEQEYHIDRQRRHNRLLHTPGVAEGLWVTRKVETGADSDVSTNTVMVSAGTAIDPRGREIVLVDQRTEIMPSVTGTVEMYIVYGKEPTDSSQDPGVKGMMRITESPTFHIRLPEEDKPADGVLLATFELEAGCLKKDPDNTVRVKSGILLSGITFDDLEVRSLTLECKDVDSGKWPKLSCSGANRATLEGDLTLDGLTLKRDNVDPGEWPTLTCSGVNQAELEGDLNVTGTLTGKLGSDMVGTNQIADNNVTMGKLAEGVKSAINAPIVSVDGVESPGGNIDLIRANAITITPDDANNRITIGENHSARTNNPHGTTAAHVKALPLSGGTIEGPLIISDKVLIGKPTKEELERNLIRLHVKAGTGMLPLIIEHDERTEWTPDRLNTIFESLPKSSVVIGSPEKGTLPFFWKDAGGNTWYAELNGERLARM